MDLRILVSRDSGAHIDLKANRVTHASDTRFALIPGYIHKVSEDTLSSGLIEVAINLIVITTQLWINQYFSASSTTFQGFSIEPSDQPI